MIVAANPYATRAGAQILAQRGSAIDAAIAAQMVLNLVEPQSSGIGGGAFILHWDDKTKSLKTYDGRESAPLAATPDRFLNTDDTRMDFRTAAFGGLPVGTPGLLRVLELAHKKYGRLAWKSLFKPAINLATEGFDLSPRLHNLLTASGPDAFGPKARAYFFDELGKPWPVGHKLKNQDFASTLSTIAEEGAGAFYQGKIAQAIVDKVALPESNKGTLTLEDLANYQAKERPPVCVPYREYKVCGMGPPSSGALTIGQVLKLIEPFDLGDEPMTPNAVHLIAEAQKLAFADRRKYMADPDFTPVPTGLLDPTYMSARRSLISHETTMGRAKAGAPPNVKKSSFGEDATIENKGTSHISIVDASGNAVSMTTTIESGFGANIMVGGFLLNNELTDFSFFPKDKSGTPIANRVEPGKRPRSSMSPTMVFDKHSKLHMITGSPGGSRIIPYVLKTLIAHIDWGLDAAEAAALTNFGSRNGPLEIEPDGLTPALDDTLSALGHKIRQSEMTSGSHIIIRTKEGLQGGADPRREGLAIGE